MKHSLPVLAALFLAAPTYAQGTINFINRVATVLDARVFYRVDEGGSVPADGRFVAQLYASTATDGPLSPVGAPIPFRQTPGTAQGYWLGETRVIPGVPENGTVAQIQVVAWATEVGSSYEGAVNSRRGGYGESAILRNVATGGASTPAQPLVGLTGFEILTVLPVPEPSIAGLASFGAVLLFFGRKRQR